MIKKYKVEIISPVHIGSGDKISPIEYILEDKFYRINMDSLFEDKDFPREEFIEKAKTQIYLGDFYSQAKKHKSYYLEICEELKRRKIIKEVLEFIKSGGKVFIPGSSLKGAIRTAIIYYAIKNKEEIHSFVKNELIKLSKKGGDRKRADDRIDEKFFGKTTHDFMKGLIVSDSNLFYTDVLKLQLVKVLSVNVANKLQQKLDLLVEALKIGSKFEISIKIDDFYFREEVKELGFSNKKEYLENLPKICNEYAKELIEYEMKFFKKYGNWYKDLIEFYEDLKEEDGFLLRISWGTGWHSMSIARLFQEESFFFELRKKFKLGKRKNPPYFFNIFPKTRKVVVDDKIYPLGWIKLEEVK